MYDRLVGGLRGGPDSRGGGEDGGCTERQGPIDCGTWLCYVNEQSKCWDLTFEELPSLEGISGGIDNV